MYELIQVAENTFYMDCPAKVGIVKVGGEEVVLIDSGSDRDAGKKVKKLLDAAGWRLRAIYNTHSHADHIGGNRYLQEQTGCSVFAPGIERCFTEYPVLEPTMLYGGYAFGELRNKFLMAAGSRAERLTDAVLPEGMEVIPLPGHCFEMAGFRTKDDVVFLADCLSGEETLRKYRIGYLYDVGSYLATLETVRGMTAKCFIPSHAEATEDIAPLAQYNIEKTREIIGTVLKLLSAPAAFEDLLAGIFREYGLTMNLQQNMLLGSTVRSYLSYLKEEGQVGYFFADNRMLWQRL